MKGCTESILAIYSIRRTGLVMGMQLRPTERFTDRVDDYRQYRPRYPATIVDLLARECGLSRETTIADIAAGTGLLAEIFLAHGNPVIAVEPNARMREACAALEVLYPRLRCAEGTAEVTNLLEHTADMVTVGQAMHWFDLGPTRTEFMRILRPGGWCVVVYNHRHMDGDEFHAGYERILKEFGPDYQMIESKHLHEEKLVDFFSPAQMYQAILPNAQKLNLDGLLGRILSSSYMPQPGQARHSEMLQESEALFARCQQNDHVRLQYDCAVSYAQLD